MDISTYLARTRLGMPMLPIPMKPILMMFRLALIACCVRANRLGMVRGEEKSIEEI